jgi:murein DD-endopeptidase MepM/ murein hydrolase activator NlpD
MITRRLVFALFIAPLLLLPAPPAFAAGQWQWPITGPILRGYDPPDSPYAAGHRGIDIGAPVGTPVRSPEAGKVTFAGKVGGHLFLTIDHGGGVSSTYSWLTSIAVKKGNVVVRGDVVARSGSGHPGDEEPSLHLGVKLNGAYVDPLDYLGPIDISDFIRLAPLGSQSAAMAVGTSTPWSGGHPSWFP